MKIAAYITKPHGDQKTWDVMIVTEDFDVAKRFKTMKSAVEWLQTWSGQRGVSLELRHTLR